LIIIVINIIELKFILSHGTDINNYNTFNGSAPLFNTYKDRHITIVKYFDEYGSNINKSKILFLNHFITSQNIYHMVSHVIIYLLIIKVYILVSYPRATIKFCIKSIKI